MVLNLDFNFPPVEGTSGVMNPPVAPAESSKGLVGSPIDVEAIDDCDDDELTVLPSSAAFPQGRNRTRRTRRVTVDLEAPMEIPPAQTGTQMSNATCSRTRPHPHGRLHGNIGSRWHYGYVAGPTTNAFSTSCVGVHTITSHTGIGVSEPAAILLSLSSHTTGERTSTPNMNNINNQQDNDLEGINFKEQWKNAMSRVEEAQLLIPVPPPPKEPNFTCPLCFDPLKLPCATSCGHIFCQICIEACIASSVKQRKGRLCPACRSKLPAKKSFHRIYLPNAD